MLACIASTSAEIDAASLYDFCNWAVCFQKRLEVWCVVLLQKRKRLRVRMVNVCRQ